MLFSKNICHKDEAPPRLYNYSTVGLTLWFVSFPFLLLQSPDASGCKQRFCEAAEDFFLVGRTHVFALIWADTQVCPYTFCIFRVGKPDPYTHFPGFFSPHSGYFSCIFFLLLINKYKIIIILIICKQILC